MSAHESRRGWPWDSYARLAPILRDLGIDPGAAFERLSHVVPSLQREAAKEMGAALFG